MLDNDAGSSVAGRRQRRHASHERPPFRLPETTETTYLHYDANTTPTPRFEAVSGQMVAGVVAGCGRKSAKPRHFCGVSLTGVEMGGILDIAGLRLCARRT